MKIGYIRVSSKEQNIARQKEALKQLGAEKIFIDYISGKNTKRPQLQAMLSFMREGDCVIVSSFDRLARNTRDLLELIEMFQSKGVTFVSQSPNVDTSNDFGKFMVTIFGAVAELERSNILLRQREGIEIAKTNGVYKGRKPKAINQKQWNDLYAKWKAGDIGSQYFMDCMGMSKSTFYRKLKSFEKEEKKA